MQILKGVSRSFYLSLRVLPCQMRGAASLAYLLARTSDTVADAAEVAVDVRIGALDEFRECLDAGEPFGVWPGSLLAGIDDARELLLLQHTRQFLGWLDTAAGDESRLIRQLAGVIIGGQRLDLEAFGKASADQILVLGGDAALDDYTWRVAGCVGEFWTRLGVLTMGDAFSGVAEEELVAKGIRYGKGLQLVNILRDLPRDLEDGRCYLPVSDPSDRDELMAAHHRQLLRARAMVADGIDYGSMIKSRRARAASLLPALIAEKTLDRLAVADWQALEQRVKVGRWSVYQSLAQAFCS